MTIAKVDYGRPYIPERNYMTNGYKPIGQTVSHFCLNCKNYYKNLKEVEITSVNFPPSCYGDISQQDLPIAQDVSEDDRALVEIYSDPIKFAAAEFQWYPRWYQREMILCSSLQKVIRAGRRTGKTEAAAVMILWRAYVHKNHSILIVCPFQSQVTRIFDVMRKLIGDSLSYSQSIVRDVNNPHLMALANGSQIRGFSSGSKSGGKSNQVRGQDANFIVLDEVDYLSEDDFNSILAILASHPDCGIWASSTPTGARTSFFQWITNKDMGFKEFHYISSESPSWTDKAERLFREQYAESIFNREFLAEFGDEAGGVYKNSDINRSLVDYAYSDCFPQPSSRYIIGVDWNETFGVHIIVTECSSGSNKDVKYKVVEKLVVEPQEFTQTKAVYEIIRLNYKWSAEFVYVDAGYGASQVEMLKKYGKDNPQSKLDKKVKAIHMGGNVTILDPVTGDEVMKPAKPFLVNVSARQLEAQRCIFPAGEDTNAMVSEEGGDGSKVGLVQQMRMFKVEKYNKNGSPSYSQGYDHTLVAWQLSILGFYMEFSDANRFIRSGGIQFSGSFGEKFDVNKVEETIEKKKEQAAKFKPIQRALGKSRNMFSKTAGAALRHFHKVKSLDNQPMPRSGENNQKRRSDF